MIIEKNDGATILVLAAECSITDVEADTDKVRSLMNTRPGRIEVQAGSLEEIDTAYLQLLLSLAYTAEHWDIPFSVSNAPDALRKACALYGENISVFMPMSSGPGG
jgi:ABC-type transporter Mla MlaB component